MHIILEHSVTVEALYKHRTFHPQSHSLSTSLKILVLQDHCSASNPAVLQHKHHRKQQQKQTASILQPSLPSPLQRAMSLAQEKGASSWLTTLPIKEFGFALHKSAFRDALALRYGWQALNVPTTCPCAELLHRSCPIMCKRGLSLHSAQ